MLSIYIASSSPIIYPNQHQPKLNELRKLSKPELKKLIPGSKISTLAPDETTSFYEIFNRSGRMFSYHGSVPTNADYNIGDRGICISNSDPEICRDIYVSKSLKYYYRINTYRNNKLEKTENFIQMRFAR